MPASAALVKDITFGIRAEYPKSTIIVIGSHENGKPMITVSVSDDLTSRFNAGQMVREAAKLIQGGGGGQPTLLPPEASSKGSMLRWRLLKCLPSLRPVDEENLFGCTGKSGVKPAVFLSPICRR